MRWVFQGSQKELTDILNQYLRRPEIKLVGHALKVDAIYPWTQSVHEGKGHEEKAGHEEKKKEV